jgi:hypothetical protein
MMSMMYTASFDKLRMIGFKFRMIGFTLGMIGLIVAFFSAATACAHTVTSHTYFSVRQPLQAASSELVSLTYDRLNDDLSSNHPELVEGFFQVIPFGGRSVCNKECANPLGLYFTPFGKTALIAGEVGSQAVQNNEADLIANYFGVQTVDPTKDTPGPNQFNTTNGLFQSCISFNPHQSVVGCGLYYLQRLSSCQEHAVFISINMPIVHVRNFIGFQEVITNPGGYAPTSSSTGIEILPGYVGSMTAALQGDTVFGTQRFLFGKIPYDSCRPMTMTRIADLDLRLGYNLMHSDTAHFDGTLGLIVPTGNKPTAEFIFEPVVGNNKHFGLGLGSNFSFQLYECSTRDITVSLQGATENRFLFSNIQPRSYDLLDKQWSRYMWLYPNAQAVPIAGIVPGINLLTSNLRVHPHFNFTFNTALFLSTSTMSLELGYNRYARQAETVELCGCCPQNAGIVGIDTTDTLILHTKSNSTMSQAGFVESRFIDVDRTPNFVPITCATIDLESAAHPAMATNTVYAAFGYHNDECRWPILVGLGGSYEVSDTNAAFNRWLVWAKGGLTF